MLQQLKGVIALIAVVSNIVFWFIPIMLFAIVRFVLPFAAVRRFTSRVLMACGENWISVNSWLLESTQGTKFHITGTEDLRRHDWYLIASNHQSWVDIVVLQRVFNRRIPFPGLNKLELGLLDYISQKQAILLIKYEQGCT